MSTATVERKRQVLTRERRLDQINQEVREDPNFEHLRYRRKMLAGGVNPYSPVVFIAPCPFPLEAAEQRMFMGQQGKVLDAALSIADLKRSAVYITYLVKYPTSVDAKEPRDPSQNEIEVALPYLVRELGIIRPKIIVPMGRLVTNLFVPGANIIHNHGEVYEAKGRDVFPIWSPVAAIYNKQIRDDMFEDMRKLGGML